ncbi:General secretion pathway protein M [compost metagenome]
MNSSHHRSTLLLIIAALFLVLLILFAWLYVPSNKELSSIQQEKEQLDRKIQSLQLIIDKKKTVKGKLDEAVVQEALPLWDNTEQLVQQMRDIGKSTEATLNSASFSIIGSNDIHLLSGAEDQMYPNVKQMKIVASLEGTDQQMRSWLNQLEKLPRIIIVDSLRLNKSANSGNDDSDRLKAELTFIAYFDPDYEPLLEHPILPKTAK